MPQKYRVLDNGQDSKQYYAKRNQTKASQSQKKKPLVGPRYLGPSREGVKRESAAKYRAMGTKQYERREQGKRANAVPRKTAMRKKFSEYKQDAAGRKEMSTYTKKARKLYGGKGK